MNKQKHKLVLFIVGTISLVFIILSILVSIYPDSFIDRAFSSEVQEHQNRIFNSIMEIISWPGYMPRSFIMVIAVSAIFYFLKYKKEAFYILLTLLSGLISALMKIAVNRPRPTDLLVRIIETTKSQSFPSGHVILYVVFFGFLTILMVHLKSIPKKIRYVVGAISLLFIFSVAFARIYLGAHWLTDVLGGFLLGIICLYIISSLYFRKED
jgi:membrane-associated phospholipid phosphatase